MPKRPAPTPAVLSATLTAAALLAALGGCSSSRSRVNEQQILRSAGLAPGERAPGSRDADEVDPETLDARVQADESPADLRVLVGPPEGEEDEALPVDAGPAPLETIEQAPTSAPASLEAPASRLADSGFVDAVVGQINGRPVYASEFFTPMDARLRADAARLPPRQWREQTRQVIKYAVFDKMREELMLAEFQAQLTPETKQGLVAFVDRMRQEIVAQNLGSESLAGKRLQESEGLTLDEKVSQERDRQIILAQLRKAVGDRMYVSWREVELAYERDYDLYNPAPSAHLRMIQVSGAENIEAVREALAAGTPFEQVARDRSEFRAEEGGLWTIEVDRAGYDKTRIFAPDELNSVAVALKPGEVSAPFEWSGSTVWLTLEEIEQPPRRSLYDAQLEITERLQNTRYREEEQGYVARLLGRASVTDLTEMTERLMVIAEERYLDVPRSATEETPSNGGR